MYFVVNDSIGSYDTIIDFYTREEAENYINNMLEDAMENELENLSWLTVIKGNKIDTSVTRQRKVLVKILY